jgi:omega-6 fatty acid desaturase (delta-12 desaturase)
VANNVCVLTSWWLMSRWLGAGLFWSCYAIVMTCSAAIFICIFFVQHNFPDSYAHRTSDWSYFKGAIEGSSNLILPPILHWFSADIAFHSIHHLCERIPNYRLRACHEANQHLLKDCAYLRLSDLPRCFNLILWDSSQQRLVSMAEA